MAKTKPIGVRFDEDLLNTVKEAGLAKSPQKALNLYEGSYLELVKLRVAENNKPENKAKIEAERNPTETKEEVAITTTPQIKRTYDDLLSEAKTGVTDITKFKSDLNRSNCTPGQKEMILSKVKK